MTIGGNLGAPGTRITRRLGPDDEVWLYVWQSIAGAVALDLVLTLTLLSYLIIGWWSMALFCAVVGFLVGLVALAFGRPQWEPVRWTLGNLWAIGALVGALIGHRWYAMIGEGVQLILDQIAVLGLLPWWAYAAAGSVVLAILLWTGWKAALVLAVLAPLMGILIWSDGGDWRQAWLYLRWLLIPYSWPVMGFALLLALVMGKEMLFPSLEWVFKPVSLEELREVGLIGLWLPGLIGKEVEEPLPERTVRVEVASNGEGRGRQERYAFLDDSPEARAFYAAVKRGESFALRTARKHGLSRKSFDRLRDIFFARGWAEWYDDRHHEQGVRVLDEGSEVIEHLVLADTTP